MDSSGRQHPADLKAKEILFAVSTNVCETTNKRNYTMSPTSSTPSRRSSINLDVCYELDQRKIRDRSKQDIFVKSSKTCPRYDKNYSLNKAPISSSSANVESLECEKEILFIRAVIWMKSIVEMMEEVSENEIKKVFGALLSKNTSPNNLLSSPSRSIACNKVISSQCPRMKFDQNPNAGCNFFNNCAGQKRQYLIPDVEEPTSPTSPTVSFCESPSQHISKIKALHSVDDSGIVLLDSFDTTSKFEFSELTCNKENNPPQFSKVVHASKDIEDGHVKKKLKHSEFTVSPTFLSSLIENLRLNNFVLGEVRIILRVLEKNETAQNYIKNGLIVRDAINTVVRFLNQFDTKNDMSSSIVYIQLCTEDIMATIKKIFRSRTYENLNGVARYNQLITILEFCDCRKICEKTIDLLINLLTKLTEMIGINLSEYENQPMMSNDAESHLLCHILQMAVKKYCDVVGRSGNINENSHHHVTQLWRKLWKNHKKYETSLCHDKELKSDWINKLEKLINPQFPVAFSMIGDCKAIWKAIKILSTPPFSPS